MNFLLDEDAELETDAYDKDKPFTLEVWPSAATGRHPRDRGVTGEQEWDNPALRIASMATRHLPASARRLLGRPFRMRGESQTFQETASTHPFDLVYGWPGLTDARNLDEAWMWLNQARNGALTEDELFANLRGNTGKEFGWLVTASSPQTPLVGAHSHILDVAGHVFAKRPDKLEAVYRWVDDQLAWLREHTDALVILSDHGMETTLFDDPSPGEHSWHALVSATGNLQAPLPETIYDVRDWLEGQRSRPVGRSGVRASVDTNVEHLRDLGYLEQ